MSARRGTKWKLNLLLGSVLGVVVLVLSVTGLFWTPGDPLKLDIMHRLQGPSGAFPFGTDEFGRDVLSRVLAGAHYSLAIGFGAMMISVIAGVPLGLLAAFNRGLVAAVIMRAVDLLI
ncbi:MAG: ABC transporter permease, partial [Rhizobiaceae bacterium]